MNGSRMMIPVLSILGLGVFGAFFLLISGGGFSTGFPKVGTELSLFATIGILGLVSASALGMRAFEVRSGQSPISTIPYALMLSGVSLLLVASFVPFPVGCNSVGQCPANPQGTWSTVWPNAFSMCLGAVFLTSGYGRLRSPTAMVTGLGVGLVIGGLFLLVSGISIGYVTSCPANGCLPLTGSQWWSLFWPDVIAEAIGAVMIVSGSIILFARVLLRKAPPELSASLRHNGQPLAEAQRILCAVHWLERS